MKVTVNGAVAEVVDGMSVGDLVRARVDDRRRVAVARNGEVVPRAEWDATPLAEVPSPHRKKLGHYF